MPCTSIPRQADTRVHPAHALARPPKRGQATCLALPPGYAGLLDGPVADAGDTGCGELLKKLLTSVDAAEPTLLSKISESGLLGEASKERLAGLLEEALKE